MSSNAPMKPLTAANVRECARRAFLGEVGDIPDPGCAGLMLRMREKKVTWSYRGKLGAKQKRWNLGGDHIDPTTARPVQCRQGRAPCRQRPRRSR